MSQQIFIPAKKAALLVPSGPEHDKDRKHLFIVLTDPDTQKQIVLMVSISSIKEGRRYDDSCVLDPGDHPFVRVPSYVDYSRPQLIEAQKLINGVSSGKLSPRGMVSQEVYANICQGFLRSNRVARKFLDFFKRANGIED